MVKLQKNALTVLEPPTGKEEGDDIDDSASGSDTNHSTCREVQSSFHAKVIDSSAYRFHNHIKMLFYIML